MWFLGLFLLNPEGLIDPTAFLLRGGKKGRKVPQEEHVMSVLHVANPFCESGKVQTPCCVIANLIRGIDLLDPLDQ